MGFPEIRANLRYGQYPVPRCPDKRRPSVLIFREVNTFLVLLHFGIDLSILGFWYFSFCQAFGDGFLALSLFCSTFPLEASAFMVLVRLGCFW